MNEDKKKYWNMQVVCIAYVSLVFFLTSVIFFLLNEPILFFYLLFASGIALGFAITGHLVNRWIFKLSDELCEKCKRKI
jgi:ABC-type multidrug transport system permease subunit